MRLPRQPLLRLALILGFIVALALVISACDPIAPSTAPGTATPGATLAPGASAAPVAYRALRQQWSWLSLPSQPVRAPGNGA